MYNTFMEHKHQLKVRFNECDMYGHVNHTNYITYLETARLEFLRSKGFSAGALQDAGFLLYIVNVNISYLKSALFEDDIEVVTRVKKMTHIKGVFSQHVVKDKELLAKAEVTWACVDASGKPRKMPEKLKKLGE